MDSNSGFADLLLKMFGDEFEVLRATDASLGVQTALESRPDLILLGMMLSRMSPVELLRRLQYAKETQAIPVIILTDQFFEAGAQKALQREPNVFCFLERSSGLGTIISQIQQVLGGSR